MDYEMKEEVLEKPYILRADGEEISEHAAIQEALDAMQDFIENDAWSEYHDGPEWDIRIIEVIQIIHHEELSPINHSHGCLAF